MKNPLFHFQFNGSWESFSLVENILTLFCNLNKIFQVPIEAITDESLCGSL